MSRERVEAWLASHNSNANGLIMLSPDREYTHIESEYDAQYGINDSDLRQGLGVVKLLEERNADLSAPAWEIGCGTGAITLGFAAHHRYPLFLASDMSSSFLKIIDRKLSQNSLARDKVRLAIYDADTVFNSEPENCFSLVMLIAVLHHVSCPESFINKISKLLVKNGVLFMQEPCAEGMLIFAILANIFEYVMQQRGSSNSKYFDHARLLRESSIFYLRRDFDKSAAEDKYAFRIDEILQWGTKCGLECEYLSNYGLWDSKAPERFRGFIRYYISRCMNFGEEFTETFCTLISPYLDMIDELYTSRTEPSFGGIWLLHKR